MARKQATAQVLQHPASDLGSQINALHALREQIRELNTQVKALESQKTEMEIRLIEAMEAQGIDQSRGKRVTASISLVIVPRVEDWDAFYAYIKRTNKFYLLERRPASVAYREELEARRGKPIPGVQSFEKKTLHLTTR